MNDLKLLGQGEPWCVISKDLVALQCGLGLSRPDIITGLLSYAFPGLLMKSYALLDMSESIWLTKQLSSSSAIFLATIPPHSLQQG